MFEELPVQLVMQLITTHTDVYNQKKKKKGAEPILLSFAHKCPSGTEKGRLYSLKNM